MSDTRRGTPRKKVERRETSARRAAEPSERLMSPGAIIAFVIVAALAVGGFALWRTSAAPEPEPEPKKEVPAVQVDPAYADRVERLLADLTLEQKVAQMFIVRPEAITGVDVAIAAGEATRDAIIEYPVGGICYFAQNLQSPSQTQTMLRNTQNYTKDACGLPLFCCVDEEGGTVARVASNELFGVENVGDMAAIGATKDPEKARDAANLIGGYLVDLGFNVDFAPVSDIATSEDETMAARSFGATAADVSPMVAAQVEGFTRAGILCSAKHFPGIGGAEGDSHDDRIYSDATAEQMLNDSCLPFKAAIEQNVPMIMVGHLTCLKLENSDLPASLNPAVIEDLLRIELGYDGLVVTDSLEMGAVTEVAEADEQAVLAVKAGADLVLMPSDFKKAYNGLLDAIKSGEISEKRIDDSVRRIIEAKLAYNL